LIIIRGIDVKTYNKKELKHKENPLERIIGTYREEVGTMRLSAHVHKCLAYTSMPRRIGSNA